jgi:hypothetical protein
MAELDAERRKLISLIAERGDERVTTRETQDGLGIHNPTHRQMPVIVFLLLWLGGWSAGEYFALYEIFSGGGMSEGGMFLIVWVTFWTLGGIAAWWIVLWQMFGVEQLFITSGAVVREVGLWRLRRRRVYPLHRVSGFKLASGPRMGGPFTNGAIAFTAEGTERRFGIGMSDKEARSALAAIRRHMPRGNAASGGNLPDAGKTGKG